MRSALFQIAIDKKVRVVAFPMSAGGFARLLLVDEHQQVDQIAFQQLRVKQLLNAVLQ